MIAHIMLRPKATDAKTKRLLDKLTRLQVSGGGKRTTGWEKDFLQDVKLRVSKHGSAFVDAEKGSLDQSLSIKQYYKMQEIKRLIKHREKKLGGRK